MKKSNKFLIESGILLTSISLRAKGVGKGLKDYFYEEETISHISLVLYDLLPLSFKIGMRYQKFHEIFEKNFKGIRNALLGEEIKEEEIKEPSKTKIIKKPRKSLVKKVSIVKSKRVQKDEK